MSNAEPSLIASALPTLGDRELAHFASLVESETGIRMPLSKSSMLHGRLVRRLRALGMNSFAEYQAYLDDKTEGPNELYLFINAVTTNKTDFFREPTHFDFMTAHCLPEFKRQYPHRCCTAWSAACSTGEEPYTIGMVMSDFASRAGAFPFKIMATDISTSVIEQAEGGLYSFNQIAPVPEDFRRRFFQKSLRDSSVVRITPELRRQVAFHRLNLMDDHYRVQTMFDIILLRNVLIYFERAVQIAVVTKLCRHLRPGGYLFVGHSDSLATVDIGLEPVDSAVFRKIA